MEPLYKQRILAFVDILGFKNMIEKSKNDVNIQLKIDKAMRIIHSYKSLNDSGENEGLNQYDVHVSTFSDSAVISYPLDFEGGLFLVCMDLIHMQQELLNLGLFIRGGITIGDAYHDQYIVYGPAMVEAYRLESQCAKFPRVILTEETLLDGQGADLYHQNETDLNLMHSLVRKDEDGYYFLNYFTKGQEFDNPEIDYPIWIQRVRKAIVDNLNICSNDSKAVDIYTKYIWVKRQWNSLVDDEYKIVCELQNVWR